MLRSPAMRWAPLALAALFALGCETFDPKHPLIGKPAAIDNGPAIFVWVTDGLWHVRMLGSGHSTHRFQGSVAGVHGGVLDLELTRPELRDAIALAGDAVQFDVEAKGDEPTERLAGFDVRVASGGCARFDLYVDGHHHSERVRLGPKQQRPTRVPFDRCP